ncbi:MAG: hypothetical protein ABSD63_14825 [Candidatus Korobacteraceae bacterium]
MPHPSKAQPSTVRPAVAAQHHHGPSLVRGLSLTDSVMLLAGGIIGSGIFLTPDRLPPPCARRCSSSACGWRAG